MDPFTRVYLEVGKKWVFACALDWPGWCRRGRGDEAAIGALLDYAPRYETVAGPGFDPGPVEVVGRVPGNATTDFGAPAAIGPWDRDLEGSAAPEAHIALLRKAWGAFDQVVASAPETLRKGPRGGGRDRDRIAEHVREAERAYSSRAGVRVPPRTPWPEQRDALAEALADPGRQRPWPAVYALRRTAWHVLDHAWEIEDRSEPGA